MQDHKILSSALWAHTHSCMQLFPLYQPSSPAAKAGAGSLEDVSPTIEQIAAFPSTHAGSDKEMERQQNLHSSYQQWQDLLGWAGTQAWEERLLPSVQLPRWDPTWAIHVPQSSISSLSSNVPDNLLSLESLLVLSFADQQTWCHSR